MSCKKFFFFFFFVLIVFAIPQLQHVGALEFSVGEDKGWKIPPHDDKQMYNNWAKKNRFQVGDTLEFNYNKKDSIMVVSQEDYEDCNSSHPIFFSNSGHTTFKLDHSGLFYFISGASGHCDKGLKMIIKVLGHTPPLQNSPPPPGNGSHANPPSSNAAVSTARISHMVIMKLFTLVLGLSLL